MLIAPETGKSNFKLSSLGTDSQLVVGFFLLNLPTKVLLYGPTTSEANLTDTAIVKSSSSKRTVALLRFGLRYIGQMKLRSVHYFDGLQLL